MAHSCKLYDNTWSPVCCTSSLARTCRSCPLGLLLYIYHTIRQINNCKHALVLLLQLMIVGSLTTDGNLWGSRSALRVIGVYVAQLGWNAASRYITKDWGEDVVVNLVGLLVFAMVAGLMLIIQIRSHAQIWAEALQSGEVTDAKTIRCGNVLTQCAHYCSVAVLL